MDEAEAEAILLALMALPPHLKWIERSEHVCVSHELEPGQFYTIVTEPGGDGRFMSRLANGGGSDWNPVFYATLAAAKAGCERHFLTGKWKLEYAPLSAVLQLTEAKTEAEAKAQAEVEAQIKAELEALLPLRELPLRWKGVRGDKSDTGPLFSICASDDEEPRFEYVVQATH